MLRVTSSPLHAATDDAAIAPIAAANHPTSQLVLILRVINRSPNR
jgi:hypothetical protein